MCDYSLGGIPNRLAVEGDQLLVHSFRTGTIGLAAVADAQRAEEERAAPKTVRAWVKSLFDTTRCEVPAVCIPPGALLVFRGIPRPMREEFGLQEEEGVRFIQNSLGEHTHRDGVRFSNGREILLQRIKPGLRVEVLSLASAETETVERKNEEIPV